jgi:hypothetical protein
LGVGGSGLPRIIAAAAVEAAGAALRSQRAIRGRGGIDDERIQPSADRKSGSARRMTGDFARLWINPFDVPGHVFHPGSGIFGDRRRRDVGQFTSIAVTSAANFVFNRLRGRSARFQCFSHVPPPRFCPNLYEALAGFLTGKGPQLRPLAATMITIAENSLGAQTPAGRAGNHAQATGETATAGLRPIRGSAD